MKTIGLLGGLSWESSLEYYRLINLEVKERLGGFHSCQCLMYSFDFAEVEKLQHQGNWDRLTELMADAAQAVNKGGADLLLICSNTMHKMADDIAVQISIPLLHIADVAAEAILAQGLDKVGLLGTRFTMEGAFYKTRIEERYPIEVIIPPPDDREEVHRIIYQELVQGVINPASRVRIAEIIQRLSMAGAQGVILGCTEIPLLVTQADSTIPLFDTTRLHARQAVEAALT